MATTSNFSWATPDDTANVKDGASAIRSLGTAIDTTVATMVPKSIVDAKGDIIAATAADTVSKLTVGSNDTVLTADSSTATGLKWATPASGSYTSLASGTLSTAQVTLSSISANYRTLVLVINNPYLNSGTPIGIRINASTEANYNLTRQTTNNATQLHSGSETQWPLAGGNNLVTSAPTSDQFICTFNEYTATNVIKRMQLNSYHANGDGGTSGIGSHASVSSAITSITIRSYNGSSTFSGGTYTLYGVK